MGSIKTLLFCASYSVAASGILGSPWGHQMLRLEAASISLLINKGKQQEFTN